jgi:lipoprotein-anchoring transpeptidase ErfK/SrfK
MTRHDRSGGLRALAVVLMSLLLVVSGMATGAQAQTEGYTGPPVPAASGEGRRVVYSNSAQRVWLVTEEGVVERTYLVSGRRNYPRAGTYSVFSKSERTTARRGSLTMGYMVRFARGRSLAIGFHDIPRTRAGRPIQSESQLGTFRSAGCVRQSTADAQYLYGWAPIGTTVVVVR